MVSGSTLAAIDVQLSLIDQVEAAVPGSVVAIEGANEINNWPVTFNGVSGLQGAVNMQAAIYQAVHNDPKLAGVSVDYFTGYAAGGVGVGPDPATTAGLANFDTQHPYPNGGQAPAFWVSRAQALPNATSPTEPAVFTETGYSTNQVDPTVQAKYTLDLLMDTANEGISKTYLYELMDAYAPGSRQGDAGYGLFDYTKAPKPVATAIHNLTTLLQDTGPQASSFLPTPLNYSISGLPSTGNSMVIEKSNGLYVIAVWAEPQIWNNTAKTEIAAPTETVTISLPTIYGSAQVFDPLTGVTAISSYSNANSVTVALTDHPLLIELSAPISSIATSGGGTGSATTPLVSGAVNIVSAGALMTGAVVNSGASLSLLGTGSGTVINAGGSVLVSSGGLDSGVRVLGRGGSESILSGGATMGATVSSGGGVYVESGGTLSGAVINSGGHVYVLSGGVESAAVVMNGGGDVISGGEGISATVNSGGTQCLQAGGQASGTIVSSGGGVLVSSGGTVSAALVAGGRIIDMADGLTFGDVVRSGGAEKVSSGGLASGSVISSGGAEYLYAGGLADAAVISAGGAMIMSGGATSGDVINGGELMISSGAEGLATMINSGGTEVAFSGGVASGSIAVVGANLVASSGGAAIGDLISGGRDVVYAGGRAVADVIEDGGAQKVSGGATTGTVLSSGGAEYVYSGGAASGTIISNGGYLFASSGGLASTTVVSGGTVSVLSGAALSGGLILEAGSAVISGTAAAGQTISFTGSAGDLVLANLPGFGASIAGMTGSGQQVDLAGFAYNSAAESASWSQSAGSGTLTISDGTKVAHLTLIGAYVTSNFNLSNDGHGGTFVVDPPLSHGVAGFVQAMAVMGGGAMSNEVPSLLSCGGAFTSAVIAAAAVSGFAG